MTNREAALGQIVTVHKIEISGLLGLKTNLIKTSIKANPSLNLRAES